MSTSMKVCRALLLFLAATWSAVAHAQDSTCNPNLQCCATIGTGTPCSTGVGNPINTQTGNKFQREVDMPALPGVLGLELIRYYNSNASGLYGTRGLFGRGWKMSYEIQASYAQGGVRLEDADGTARLYKPVAHKSAAGKPEMMYRSALAEHGQITSTADKTLVWKNAYGTEYQFSHKGQLTQITAATGEFTTIERDAQGRLIKVQDPQGRLLEFHYLPQDKAVSGAAYKGIQAVDTPVGQFQYAYGIAPPASVSAKEDRDALMANLVQVKIPQHVSSGQPEAQPSVARIYYYEDTRWPTLLTGISVKGQGGDSKHLEQRIVTWGYDARGRANLSVKGEPARLQVGVEPKRLVEGTGIEQVTLDYSQRRADGTGVTLLTNSLGKLTKYEYAKVNNSVQLVAVTGAGCATCGPVNIRYHYSKGGKQVLSSQSQANDYDAAGRLIREGATRYDYANDWSMQPNRMTRPSVVAGKHMVVNISYNSHGQPTQVTQIGFNPLEPSSAIERTTRYTYELINNRSVLKKVDGPLANGAKGDPSDSDVTLMTYDAKAHHLVSVEAPGNLKTTLHYDAAGRVVKHSMHDGYREVETNVQYAGLATIANEPQLIRLKGHDAKQSSQSSEPLEITIRNTQFNALGKPVATKDSAGRSVTQHYDLAGRALGIADEQGFRSNKVLDTEGHLQISGLYLPGQTQVHRAAYYWHDEMGRLTKRLLPDGRVDSFVYDDAGFLTSREQSHGQGQDLLHTYLTNAERSAQVHIAQSSDGAIQVAVKSISLKRNTNDKPSTVSELRDDFNQVVRRVLPDHGVKIASYDQAGRVVSIKGADGYVQQYRYHPAGWLLERSSQGVVQATMTYEGALLSRVVDPVQTSQYSYDALGRKTGETVSLAALAGKSFRTTTHYDKATGLESGRELFDGQLLSTQRSTAKAGASVQSLTLHSSWAQWFNAQASALLPKVLAAKVTSALPKKIIAQDIVVHPFNGLSSYELGNGVKTGKVHDIAGRLTQLKTNGVSQSDYGYGVGPRIRQIRHSNSEVTESSELSAKIVKSEFQYRSFGGLMGPSEAVRALKVSASALPIAPNKIQYDELGRTRQDERYRYGYTSGGQLGEVSEVNTGRKVAQYKYNHQHQRVSKTVVNQGKQTTTHYLWQSNRVVAELNESGEIADQYLYLTEGQIATPIVKLESEQSNVSGQDRVLYIHADHRATPVAMTDAKKRVVWQAELTPWGVRKASSKPGDGQKQEAELNLRMPGQYYDAETGLHDNLHRSYNPATGRYLQPDPLGYPDGPDAYLYAGGDPINRVDPKGLYEIDIHYYMTFFLGLAAGMDYQSARTTALAAQFIDVNPMTRPLDSTNGFTSIASIFKNHEQLLNYHFVLSGRDGKVLQQYANNDVNSVLVDPSAQLNRLLAASVEAGVSRDPSESEPKGKEANPCAKFQFLGEYIHAFADTFSHRNRLDLPFDALVIGQGVGHGLHLSEPDYTYNDGVNSNISWETREARTLAAEKAVFNKLTEYGTGKGVSWEQVEGTVIAFNQILEHGEDEDMPRKKALLEAKLNDLLNNLLIDPRRLDGSVITSINFTDVKTKPEKFDGFSASLAASTRTKNLAGLKESDYPGTCLPGGTKCKPL